MSLFAPILLTVAAVAPAAAQPNGATCYAVSDGGGNNQGGADQLISITNGAVTDVGTMGTNDSEAFAIRPGFGGYAWSGNDGLGLVTVDLADGTTADAPFNIPGPKVEGLTWANIDDVDPNNDILYVVRLNGVVQGYTPAGADAGLDATITNAAFTEGTDIAWDPTADQLYAIRTNTSGGANADQTQIVTISPAVAVLNPGTSAVDLEGLGFTDGGNLIGTTGDDGVPADRLYEVNKVTGAVGASLATLAPIDNEDVDCLDPVIDANLTATSSVVCVNQDGQIPIVLTNTSDAARDYTVTVNNTTRMDTLAANSTVTETIVGLIDATFTVTATDTTADPDALILDTTEVVNCDAVQTLTATSTVVCVNQDGQIPITITNPTAGARDYTVTVNNTTRLGTVAANSSTIETIVGLVDTTYTVTATDTTADPDALVLNTTQVVDCDGADPNLEITVATACVNQDGEITFTIVNSAGAPRDYEVTVNATTRVGTAPANSTVTQTIVGLVDAAFTVTGTDTTANPDAQVLNTTQLVDCDSAPTATITQACVDFDGTITFMVTNNSGSVVNYDVVVNNTVRAGTVAAGQVATETISGLTDGVYSATALETDSDPDVTLITQLVTIECDNPLPTSIATTCVGFDGEITATITNDSGAPITYLVTVNATTRTAILAAGATATETVSGLVDGDFTVAIEKTAPAPVEVLESSTETVACDNSLTASVAKACVNDDGEITVLVTNSGATATNYKVSVNNTMRVGTVLPGQTATQTIVGLVDATFAVVVTNTTDDPDVDVLTESVVILCTSPLQGAVVDACVGIDGEITVTVTNPTNASLTYQVSANATMRAGTLTAGQSTDEVFAGLPDAVYTITVTDTTPADDVDVLVQDVTIDCADIALIATVTTDCVGQNGEITFTIENVDAVAHTYRIAVNNTVRIRTVAAGATATETVMGLVDTTYAVSTTDLTPDPDVIVDSQMVTITCDSPLTATVAQACVGLDGELTVTVTNTSADARTYDILVNNTLRAGLVAPGAGVDTQTFVGLADATFTISVTDTSVNPSSIFFTATEIIDCADVAITATATPACPTVDGEITVTMTNIDTINRTYKVSVNNTMRVATIAAGSTKTETVSGLIDTTFTVTVDDLTADPDIRVLETQVPIDCDSGLAGSAEATCVGLDGAITITIENPDNSTLTYKASVNNTNRFGLVGAGQTVTQTVSGLVDGAFTVTLMDTTPNPDVVVFTETVTVDCPDNAFNVAAVAECVGIDGAITFTIENLDTVAVTYEVAVNATVRSGPLAVGATATETISGLADGDFTVTATQTGPGAPMVVLTETVTVDCADEPLSAAVSVACVGVNGAISITVTNNDTINRTYRAQVNNTSRIATLAPGASRTETISGLIDTTFTVAVTDLTANPDMVVLTELVPVACDGDLNFSTSTTCTANDGEITVSIGNTSAAATTYKVSVNNTMRFGTVAAGQTVDQTIKNLGDGTFTVMGFNTGLDPDLLVLDTTVAIVCDEPLSVVSSVICDDPINRDILAMITNSGATPVNYQMTIAEAATPAVFFFDNTSTVPADDSVTDGYPLVPDDDFIVTVTNLDSGAVVLTETVTVACDPVVTLHETCEGGNGTIAVTVVNPNATQDLVGTLSVTGLGDKVVTISAGTTATIARTGRPDGTYSVQFVLDGAQITPVTVIDQNVLVQCDGVVVDPGVLNPLITYTVGSLCGPDGRILATINNGTGAAIAYSFDVLEIQNHIASEGTTSAGGTTTLLRTGRPNGTYTVVMVIDGVTVTETVTVNCPAI